MIMMSSDEDEAQLSEQTLKILNEFYEERDKKNSLLQTTHDHILVDEDWELSQFWYDNHTAKILSQISLDAVGEKGKVACVSCPSTFIQLQKLCPNSINYYLFEFDKRFQEKFPEQFIFYDYNNPLNIDEQFSFYFDIVLADPPYLSEECLEKISKTVRYLAKDKIVLCTGSVMEELAKKLLDLTSSSFYPKHLNNLGNEFRCFTNWDFDSYYNSIKLK